MIELDGGESRSEIVVCGVLLVMLRGEGEEGGSCVGGGDEDVFLGDLSGVVGFEEA